MPIEFSLEPNRFRVFRFQYDSSFNTGSELNWHMGFSFVSFLECCFFSALISLDKKQPASRHFSLVMSQRPANTQYNPGYMNEPAIVDPFSCDLLLSMFTSSFENVVIMVSALA